jgi:hypothetical protein
MIPDKNRFTNVIDRNKNLPPGNLEIRDETNDFRDFRSPGLAIMVCISTEPDK